MTIGHATRRRLDVWVTRIGFTLTVAVVLAIPTTLGWMPAETLLDAASATSAGDASAAALAQIDERMQGERSAAARAFAPAFESCACPQHARPHPRDRFAASEIVSAAPGAHAAHRLSTDVLLL